MDNQEVRPKIKIFCQQSDVGQLSNLTFDSEAVCDLSFMILASPA